MHAYIWRYNSYIYPDIFMDIYTYIFAICKPGKQVCGNILRMQGENHGPFSPLCGYFPYRNLKLLSSQLHDLKPVVLE